MNFGETLVEMRKRKGVTQEALAAKLYVTRQAVSLMGAVLPHLARWSAIRRGELHDDGENS